MVQRGLSSHAQLAWTQIAMALPHPLPGARLLVHWLHCQVQVLTHLLGQTACCCVSTSVAKLPRKSRLESESTPPPHECSLGFGDSDFSFFSEGGFFFARRPTSMAASSTAFVRNLLAPGVTFPLPLDAELNQLGCPEASWLGIWTSIRLVPCLGTCQPPSLTPFLSLLLSSPLASWGSSSPQASP